MTATSSTSGLVDRAVRSVRSALVSVGLFSFVVNILLLTGPLFMLQVYDRVLTSRSVPTLLALLALVVMLYAFMGVVDFARSRVLVRIGHRFDDMIGASAFGAQVAMPLRQGPSATDVEPIRDVDQLRQFFTGSGVTALFDLPWMPLYLAIVYLIHPWLGLLATAGALALCVVALVTDWRARPAMRETSAANARRNGVIEQSRRNIEVVHGMGMLDDVSRVWEVTNGRFLSASANAADVIGASAVISKVIRLFLQSAVLALGAYLAILQVISPGAMIAASIIMARALQPVEMAVQNWRGVLSARQAFRRIRSTLNTEAAVRQTVLPAPHTALAVEITALIPPGARTPTIGDIRFSLQAGSALGVIGNTGSGKSTLARALVGVWQPARGAVTLDGAPLPQYGPLLLGRSIGYLPQDVELFDGTVAQNIARFRPDASDEDIVAAARKAGVHEIIVTLANGYGTEIGFGGAVLSAGQRQRIGLARALFGDPFLLVLDEPNANLDGVGDAALNRAILGVKQRGGIVVVVAHRPSALSATDSLLVMEAGRMADYGPREEVLKRVMQRQKVAVMRPAEPAAGRTMARVVPAPVQERPLPEGAESERDPAAATG